MNENIEFFLVTLTVVLGGAAYAVGAPVIRAAWRSAWPARRHSAGLPPPHTPVPRAVMSEHQRNTTAATPEPAPTLLRGIAAFEAFKALAALAAAAGLLALSSHPHLLDLVSAGFGHLGLAARQTQAFSALDHWLAAERGPLLLGAAAYAALHLAEAWGLWHARPWGEVLGASSGAVYVPFEISHLLHQPGLLAAALLALNLAVVAFLVWRLRRRVQQARDAGA